MNPLGNVRKRIPKNPLEFIQECVRERRILWTYHVNMRLRSRSISRQAIVDVVDTYEIIEPYPTDKYLPSYLVYASYQDRVLHILFAVDTSGDNVRVVTAYRPDSHEWGPDLRKRRVP